MNVTIQGEEYLLSDAVRDDDALRAGFCTLAWETFGIDVEPWYRAGHWGEDYIPHVLARGGTVAANVSVNRIHVRMGGREKLFLQIGTVMTHPEFRGRGLSGWLMRHVLECWRGRCDGIYLYANDSVVDFYPRFGFVHAREYCHSMPAPASRGGAVRLDMGSAVDRDRLLAAFALGNSYSALPGGNAGLLMFYCTQFLRESVYWVPECSAAVIAEQRRDVLHCYDIFGGQAGQMGQILSAVAAQGTRLVEFGFTPLDGFGCDERGLFEGDTTVFVWQGGENPFEAGKVRMPELARA